MTTSPNPVEHYTYLVEARKKLNLLITLMQQDKPTKGLIFLNTDHAAEWLHKKLERYGFDTLLAVRSSIKRRTALEDFAAGKVPLLILTDEMLRDMGATKASHVYHFDLPDQPQSFIERSARIEDQGSNSKIHAFVCEDYGHNLSAINQMLGPERALHPEWYKELAAMPAMKEPKPSTEEAPTQQRQDYREGARHDRPHRERAHYPAREGRPDQERQHGRGRAHRGERHRPERPHGGRGDNRPHHSEHAHRAHHQPHAPKQTHSTRAPEASLLGTVKKIISTFFGRR